MLIWIECEFRTWFSFKWLAYKEVKQYDGSSVHNALHETIHPTIHYFKQNLTSPMLKHTRYDTIDKIESK